LGFESQNTNPNRPTRYHSIVAEWYDADHTMSPKKAKPTTIAEYIDAAPKEAQKKLREMLVCIREVTHGAQEGLKWGMPAFSYQRILVTFAAHKQHIGFYPTPAGVKAFKNELSEFVTGEGSIQFPLEKPLPLDLIRKITEFRVRESVGQDRKWRTGRRTAM